MATVPAQPDPNPDSPPIEPTTRPDEIQPPQPDFDRPAPLTEPTEPTPPD